DRVDHRQVVAGGNPIVEKRAVAHRSGGIIEILFIDAPANTLDDASLNLPFDITGVNRRPDVLGRRVSQNVDLARLGIDLDIDRMRGERAAAAFRIDRPLASDRFARLIDFFRQLPEGEFLAARPEQASGLIRHLLWIDLPDFRGPLDHLPLNVAPRL